MMNTKKRRLSRTLAIVLCALLVLSFAVPVGAASGHWTEAKIRTSYGNVNTHAFVLDTPAKDCTSFDLDVQIDMKKNTKCANWDVWVRSGSSFDCVSSFSLPGGNGSTSVTIRLNPAKDFDAVAITPTKRGSYSWSMGLAVNNICSGSSTTYTTPSGNDSSSSSSDDSGDSSDIKLLSGDYEKVKIRTGRSTYTVYAYALDTPLKSVRSIGVAINVTMNNNTHCYDWDVWVRTGGSFKKVGSMYLEDGDGFTAQTVYFDSAKNFDAIAVIPTVPGGYSWSLGLGVYNPQ